MRIPSSIGWRWSAIALSAVVCGGAVHANTVYVNTFDGPNPLSGWGSQAGYTSSAYVATGAGLAGSNALSFNKESWGGDAFTSPDFAVVTGQKYALTFSYRGDIDPFAPDNANGFIGVADGFPGQHYWLAGTIPSFLGGYGIISNVSGTQTLVDSGTYSGSPYTVYFTSNVTGLLHLVIEDFDPTLRPPESANAVAHAYFDNLRVAAVPVPTAAWGGMGLLSLGGLGLWARRRNLA